MDAMRIGNYALDTDLVMQMGEKIFFAAIILIVTWAIANAAKWAFAKLVDNVSFLQQATGSGVSIGMSLGKIVSLIIWLFGMVILLQHFGFDSAIAPLQSLLTDVFDFIPNLLGAGIIFFIGLIIARIVRDLIETTLSTMNVDKWAAKGGINEVTGSTKISSTIATIIFAIAMIVVSIAALGELGIATISEPATAMLQIVLSAIPLVIGAAILLAIAYFIATWVGMLIREIMPNLGADRAIAAMGLLPEGTTASTLVARVVSTAIMLFAAIAATKMLNFPELTLILNEVLELGGKVIFGGVIIAFGFMIANILSKLIGGSAEGSLGSQIVRYATILLFVAVGLKFMGLADSIINMAFGALVIGTAVAAALAFGLGGRDAAAKALEDLRANAAKPKAPARKTADKE